MKKSTEKCVVNVRRGKVRLTGMFGSVQKEIGKKGAKYATMNDDCTLILLTTDTGIIELYTDSGLFVRTIGCGNVRRAKFIGDNIIVFTENNEIELRSLKDEVIFSMS